MLSNYFQIVPVVVVLPRGSYMAMTPDNSPLRIGVVGKDEVEARELFKYSLERWKLVYEAQKREDAP